MKHSFAKWIGEEMKIKFDRLDELEKQVGELPEGAHPDERKPRAETWLQERANWEKEVKQLREYIKKLESRENAALKLAASNAKRKINY
jgi:hypothetical protein